MLSIQNFASQSSPTETPVSSDANTATSFHCELKSIDGVDIHSRIPASTPSMNSISQPLLEGMKKSIRSENLQTFFRSKTIQIPLVTMPPVTTSRSSIRLAKPSALPYSSLLQLVLNNGPLFPAFGDFRDGSISSPEFKECNLVTVMPLQAGKRTLESLIQNVEENKKGSMHFCVLVGDGSFVVSLRDKTARKKTKFFQLAEGAILGFNIVASTFEECTLENVSDRSIASQNSCVVAYSVHAKVEDEKMMRRKAHKSSRAKIRKMAAIAATVTIAEAIPSLETLPVPATSPVPLQEQTLRTGNHCDTAVPGLSTPLEERVAAIEKNTASSEPSGSSLPLVRQTEKTHSRKRQLDDDELMENVLDFSVNLLRHRTVVSRKKLRACASLISFAESLLNEEDEQGQGTEGQGTGGQDTEDHVNIRE